MKKLLLAIILLTAFAAAQAQPLRVVATTYREQLYCVFIQARAKDGQGKRVGRVIGQRFDTWDRTIAESQRLQLNFARGVQDLNGPIPDPVDEFKTIDADGRYFLMWGNLASGALTVQRWQLLNGPAIRARQKVKVSSTRNDQIVLKVMSPDNVRAVETFVLSGLKFMEEARQRLNRRGAEAATEVEAEVLGLFYAERRNSLGTVFLQEWTLGFIGPEAPLTGKHLSLKEKFEFRTSTYRDTGPRQAPLKFNSHKFSAIGGGVIQVGVKNVMRRVGHNSPTPYKISLVRLPKNGQARTVESHEATGPFHFRYEISPQEARDAMWQVSLESARNDSQQCAGDLECAVPYDDTPAPYIIAYVDYLKALDSREGLAGGDGEFVFVFAASTKKRGDQARSFAVRFPAEHQLDVPGEVTYTAEEIQVPFFARPESEMGPSLEINLAGTEIDDSTAASTLKGLHQAAGSFFGAYYLNSAEEGRKQGERDAKAWLNVLGWTGTQYIGPHVRTYLKDENYGMDYQQPLEFANAGLGTRGEKIHYTIKRVDARTMTGLRVTLNSITVPNQDAHNGSLDILDAYAVFATARAFDGLYGGEVPATVRIPERTSKYLQEGNPTRDQTKIVNKVIYERWALHTVPFVYVEFALYDDDDGLGQGYDQLVGKTTKSAIYSRLFLPREFLIDGHASGSKRVREERGGVTVDYTIEWFR